MMIYLQKWWQKYRHDAPIDGGTASRILGDDFATYHSSSQTATKGHESYTHGKTASHTYSQPPSNTGSPYDGSSVSSSQS